MEVTTAFIQFDKLISSKIDRRNLECDKTPQILKLIKWMDEEIDLLLAIQKMIIDNIILHQEQLFEAKRQSFKNGVESGKMEIRTGRIHPEYLFL